MTVKEREYLNQLLTELSLEDVTALAQAATKRQAEMEHSMMREAEQRFIDAYKEFRNLAPNDAKYLEWEYETCTGEIEEQAFNIYEMLDYALDIR